LPGDLNAWPMKFLTGTGFALLQRKKRLDLTVEFLVLRPKYRALFSAAERLVAADRLLHAKRGVHA
jgi:hypothetical protein